MTKSQDITSSWWNSLPLPSPFSLLLLSPIVNVGIRLDTSDVRVLSFPFEFIETYFKPMLRTCVTLHSAWWWRCPYMETLFTLLAFFGWNTQVTNGLPIQRTSHAGLWVFIVLAWTNCQANNWIAGIQQAMTPMFPYIMSALSHSEVVHEG